MRKLRIFGWAILFSTRAFASDYSYPTQLATSLPLSSLLQSSQLPQEFFRRIARHDHWRTSLSDTFKVQGYEFSVSHSSKTWDTLVGSGRAVHLRERLALTPRKDGEGKLYWDYSAVDLSGETFDVTAFSALDGGQSGFHLANRVSSPPSVSIRFYGNASMIVSVANADGSRVTKILFIPYHPSSVRADPAVIEGAGLWAAPLGPTRTAAPELPSKTPTHYLHHDLSGKKRVYINGNFPQKYVRNLRAVLRDWNERLGKNFFRLEGRWPSMNHEECLLRDVLCLFWYGGEEIPWAGMSGKADSNFDPETGIMHGGFIEVNSASKPGKNLPAAPQKYVDAILHDTMDLETAAEIILQRDQFFSFAHPAPGLLFEGVVTHEIGHFSGFSHNFLGSARGGVGQPSLTVMEYVPFPLGHKRRRLSDWDDRKIRIQQQKGSWGKDYLFCSDLDVMPKQVSGVWEKPFAACNKFDLGEPLDWYLFLAARGNQGALTPLYPDLESPGAPPTIVLTNLAFFLTSGYTEGAEKTRIAGFLCGQPQINQIKDLLAKQFGYDLVCRKNILHEVSMN